MRAVVIGPGRVGCGFAGDLLQRSGFDVTFVGHAPTINRLRRAGHYCVRLTDGHHVTDRAVPVHKATDIAMARAIHDIANADLVGVATGASGIQAIGPMLAAGLSKAARAVTVIAFENDEAAGTRLRELVATYADPRTAARHGFTGAVVERAVAHRLLPDRPDNPLLLIGEPIDTFTVEASALHDRLPLISGMRTTEDYAAAYRRKLYRYSAGHAAVAYLGHLKGYRNLHAAVLDPEVAAATREVIREGQAGLTAAYGPDAGGGESAVEAIMDRFANAALGDTVARVGRDPIRKVRAADRLVGAARLAGAAGVPAPALAHAVAAALCFASNEYPAPTRHLLPTDPHQSPLELRKLLVMLTEMAGDDDFLERVSLEWMRIASRQCGSFLISLGDHMWASAPALVPA